MRPFFAALLGLTVAALPARAQNFTGTFTATNAAGQPVTLTLQHDAQGKIIGTMQSGAVSGRVEAMLEDGALVGGVFGEGEALYLYAEHGPDGLVVTLIQPDAQGNPNYDAAMELRFARAGAAAAVPPGGQQVAPRAGPTPAAPAPAAPPARAGGSGLSDGTPLGNEWLQFLAGKKLTTMESYSSGSAGGYSSRTDVFLCSSGEFLYKDNSLVSVDVGGASGYAGGPQSATGSWRIITQGQVAGIEFRYTNGQTEQVRLEYQDGKTFANGTRVFVTPAEICP